jgi:hypothetical protein
MQRMYAKPAALLAALALGTGGIAWAGIVHSHVTCDTPVAACIEGENTAAGPGVSGTSAGIGVEGTSTKTQPGVSSTTVAARALLATSVSGTAAQGSSSTADGVLGTSAAKTKAILAIAAGNVAGKPAYAASGTAVAGSGVVARGATAFSGVAHASCPQDIYNIDCGFIPPHFPFRVNYLPYAALAVTGKGVQPPVVLRNVKGQIVFEVDDVGNVFFAGTLSCPNTALQLTDTAKNPVVTYWVCQNSETQGYSPFLRKHEPAEFDGLATLAGGVARVALTQDYASEINAAAGYRVFLTPLGDAAGPLFVATQDAGGFVVRERSEQRAPLAFAYRIVATRSGEPRPVSLDVPATTESTDAATLSPDAAGANVAGPLAAPTTCASATACVAATNTGAGAAIEGTSKTGFGVVGSSAALKGVGVEGIGGAAAGVFGSSTSSFGLEAISKTGTGLVGASNSKAGVYGDATAAGGIGIEAISASGAGVYGSGVQSFSGTGPVKITGTGADVNNVNITGAPLMIVRERADVFVVDYAGSPGYTGLWHCPSQYFVDATPVTGGATCLAQDPNASKGTTRVESAGEARLVDGSAVVGLDPSIARRLDRSQPYSINLTPEGDTKGSLYVASLGPSGFTVREHGGRSSIAFEYDVVAHVLAGSP